MCLLLPVQIWLLLNLSIWTLHLNFAVCISFMLPHQLLVHTVQRIIHIAENSSEKHALFAKYSLLHGNTQDHHFHTEVYAEFFSSGHLQ